MPYTVNGIGTHYYGKKNHQVRRVYCRSCHHLGDLRSYDTTLWIVVFFIPVIPLGRKRIIDECPACSRHFASNLAKYEMGKQLAVSGGLDEYRASPTPIRALEVHAMLLGYHQYEEAKNFRENVLEQLGDREDLLEGFATLLDKLNSFDEATSYHERLLEINPASPTGRIGVSYRKIHNNNLDEAASLSTFLMEPGAGKLYPLSVLETLADAYAKAGKHHEALRYYAHLQKEYPQIGQILAFRKKVIKSEKLAGNRESLLPISDARWWHLFSGKHPGVSEEYHLLSFVAVAMILIAIGMLGRNEYLRRHRSVYIVNGFSSAAEVQIDSRNLLEVVEKSELILPEGMHKVRVRLAGKEFVEELSISTGYCERWWNTPLWIFNIRRGAILEERHLIYSSKNTPSEILFRTGELVSYFPHIDFPFSDPPQRISTKWGRDVKKIQVLLHKLSSFDIVAGLAGNRQIREARDAAESFLLMPGFSPELLAVYEGICRTTNDVPRALEFLRSGLDRRPIQVEWHRAYQRLFEISGDYQELLNQYNKLMIENPQDGRAVYLFARLVDESEERIQLFESARRLSPDLYWPILGLASQSMSKGDWSQAYTLWGDLEKLNPPEQIVRETRHLIYLGVGKGGMLIDRYRREIGAKASTSAYVDLMEVLAVQEKNREALQVFEEWKKTLSTLMLEQFKPLIEYSRLKLLYQVGDFDSFQNSSTAIKGKDHAGIRVHHLLAMNRPEEIAQLPAEATGELGLWTKLTIATSFSLKGKRADADRWRKEEIAQLEKGGHNDKQLAKLLKQETVPELKALLAPVATSIEKAQFLADIAVRFPERRAELIPLIEKLNIGRNPPYHFLKRVVAEESKKNRAAGEMAPVGAAP